MKNVFRILVATDYSAAGEGAERYAIQLAKATGSAITFLNVFERSSDSSKEFARVERIDHSPLEFEERKLQEHVEKLYKSLKISHAEGNHNLVVRKGNIATEICAEAKAIKADFIVLGTHNASAFQQVFKDSHTWQVIDNAGIPVLAIPTGALFTGVQNLIFGTEYRKSELPVIAFLVKFAKLFDAHLTVLHVTNNGFTPEFEKDVFKDFAKDVKAKLAYDKLDIRLMHADDLNDGLNEFCLSAKSSWLIMSPEKSAMVEKAFNPITSKTRCMTFHTYVPLFTIPDFNHPGNTSFWKTAEGKYSVGEELH